jgi:hypothetical protein
MKWFMAQVSNALLGAGTLVEESGSAIKHTGSRIVELGYRIRPHEYYPFYPAFWDNSRVDQGIDYSNGNGSARSRRAIPPR